MKKLSYTLIELLIVVGILAVVSATTIPTYMNYSQEKNIDRVVASVVNDIKLVRNKSLSGAQQTTGSITSLYWTFLADCNGATAANRRVYQLTFRNNSAINFTGTTSKSLPSNYSFSTSTGGNCGANVDVSFERLTGSLRGAANMISLYVWGNGTWRRIDVYKSGNITVGRP